MKIEYRKLIDSDAAPWQQLTNIDELVWNGVYTMRVSDDDGTSKLPCSLGCDDLVTIVVKDHAPNSQLQHGRTTMQEITKVERDTGSVFVYSRTCSNVNGMPVWTNWSCKENRVKWESMSLIDKFTTAGVYNIAGERTNTADGLPINNTGRISARLVVIDCDNCVTQVLTLLNAGGGDCNIYIRTKQGNAWSIWGKLQTNIEVGAIGLGQSRSFNDLTDNGIYSGANVYATGTDANGYPVTSYETFVLVVINAYLTGGGVTQLKYSLLLNGTTSVTTRTMLHGEWGSWVDLGAAKTSDIQDGAITAQKLAADVRTKVDNPLRPLYIAAGAEYNDSGADITKTAPWGETVTHKAGYYYLNGLGDITEEQMMDIYIYCYPIAFTSDWTNILRRQSSSDPSVRTNLLRNAFFAVSTIKNLSGAFYASNLEVIMLRSMLDTNNIVVLKIDANSNFIFTNSKNLKYIVGIIDIGDLKHLASNLGTGGLLALKECRLMNLKGDLITLKDSLSISKDSIMFLIVNASPDSAITITLHPDAYARLADDAEIVAALEAQPLVSLVSA